MARTVEGEALTAAFRKTQLQVRALALRDFLRIWPVWTGDEASFHTLLAAVLPLTRLYHGLAGAAAVSYYEEFRAAERVDGTPTPRLATALPDAEVLGTLYETVLRATNDAIAAGASHRGAMDTAFVRGSGSVTRLVLKGGRDTVVLSSGADKQALGWTRVTSDTPCAFCAMLASRGPVYSADTVSFQAHDHCSCGAETYYPGSEWPGRGKEFRALYERYAAGKANPVNELRRVLNSAT